MGELKIDYGYRIKKPKYQNVWQDIVVKLFVNAYRDLLSNDHIIKKAAIIFFSSDLCDYFASIINRTGNEAYEQARKVLNGEIDLRALTKDNN